MDRRHFIQSLFWASLLPQGLGHFPEALGSIPSIETLFLMSHGDPNSLTNEENRFEISNTDSGQLIVVSRNQSWEVKIPFFSHDVIANPMDKNKVFCLSRWGQKAALVSLEKAQVTKFISYEGTNRRFNGHALFLGDGKSLICSESNEELEGVLVKRSAQDLRIEDTIPAFGYFPHQIMLHRDQNIITVANAGIESTRYKSKGKPRFYPGSCLNIIDLKARKLIHSVKIPKGFNVGHFYQDTESNMTLVGTNDDFSKAYIGFLDSKYNLRHPDDLSLIKDKSGENLSVIHHEGFGLAVVTNRRSHTLSVWDYKKAKLIKSFELRSPCGVALYDARTAIISYNYSDKKKLIALTLDNLNLVRNPWDKLKCGLGSHINRA